MTNILENFKNYHTANYHDGDTTFDKSVYKQSNGDDFDSEFVQDCYDHYVAGVELLQEGSVDNATYYELVRSNRYKHEQNIELSKEVKILRERKEYYKSKVRDIDDLVDLVKTSADSEMYLFEELQKEQEHSKQLQQKLKKVLDYCNRNPAISVRGYLAIYDIINDEKKK